MFHKPIIMFDSVTLDDIPPRAQAVAGYVNGIWVTFSQLRKKFPDTRHFLSITVSSVADGETLDLEKGDAFNDQAPGWYKRQKSRGVKRPCFYTQLSNVPALLEVLSNAGIKRRSFRLWIAHWTYEPHLCSSKCGYIHTTADATQYTNKGFSRNLDISVCRPNFFGNPTVAVIKQSVPSIKRWLRFGRI